MGLLAGLHVEYFAIGAVAALWAVPWLLGQAFAQQLLSKDNAVVLAGLLVPAVYVAGMTFDAIASLVLKPLKRQIERNAFKKAGQRPCSSQKLHVVAVVFEPALALQLDIRSTRDRVARGALVAAAPLLLVSPLTSLSRYESLALSLALLATLSFLWHRTQRLSASYEANVRAMLQLKHGVVLTDNQSTGGSTQ